MFMNVKDDNEKTKLLLQHLDEMLYKIITNECLIMVFQKVKKNILLIQTMIQMKIILLFIINNSLFI